MPAKQGTLKFDVDFRPSQVRHRDGHTWTVQEILCEWKHPGTAPNHLVKPGVVRCWQVAFGLG